MDTFIDIASTLDRDWRHRAVMDKSWISVLLPISVVGQ
jgi:hypothetical protein